MIYKVLLTDKAANNKAFHLRDKIRSTIFMLPVWSEHRTRSHAQVPLIRSIQNDVRQHKSITDPFVSTQWKPESHIINIPWAVVISLIWKKCAV